MKDLAVTHGPPKHIKRAALIIEYGDGTAEIAKAQNVQALDFLATYNNFEMPNFAFTGTLEDFDATKDRPRLASLTLDKIESCFNE